MRMLKLNPAVVQLQGNLVNKQVVYLWVRVVGIVAVGSIEKIQQVVLLELP